MVVLSTRLQCIADKVPSGSRVADIGSDHALLPSYLVLQGKVNYVVAGEVNEGPLNAARKQVEGAQLQEQIDVRKGDGLEVIAPGEVDTIVIAGMGGGLITEILTRGIDKLDGVQRLILQPNIGEELVRRWLYDHEWYVQEEDLIYEDGRFYEIILAVKPVTMKEWKSIRDWNLQLYTVHDANPCEQDLQPEWLFRFGPHLLRKGSDLFVRKWQREIEKWEQICEQLAKSDQKSSRNKLVQYQHDIGVVRRVLHCLQMDKRLFNG